MRKINILLVMILIASCAEQTKKENTKTSSDLENESIETGIKKDTLYLGYYFGMSEAEFKVKSKELEKKNMIQISNDNVITSIMSTGNHSLFTNTNYFFDSNKKLFRTVSHIYPEKSKKISDKEISIKNDVIDLIEKGNGKNYYKNGTQKSDRYWLNGNKRIDFYDAEDKYIVASSDMIAERRYNEYLVKKEKKEELNQSKKRKDIKEKLKGIAKKDFPNDYMTQEYWLDEQLKAYDYMTKLPDNNIKEKAQRDWPLDFITQKFWYNEQIEAKKRLDN